MGRVAAILIGAIVAVLVATLAYGDYPMALVDVVTVLLNGSPETPHLEMIVLDVRLPRAVLAMIIGLALAVAGTITQAIMRNPLAEPGLLGINGGAAVAAVILIVHFNNPSFVILPAFAFAGALVMAATVYLLAWRKGTSSIRIILIGIGLSALAGAAANFITAFGDVTASQRAMVWLSGSLFDSRWAKVQILALILVIPLVLAWLSASELDVIGLGDDWARSLGQRVDLTRGFMILLCAIISGAAVAAAGLIGFVGLAAPHIARRMVGFRHARTIPISALVGALLVMLADLIGRSIIAPAQLPVGLMTALLGAPFFGYLIWQRRSG
jgi:iron complex transport system permease protein